MFRYRLFNKTNSTITNYTICNNKCFSKITILKTNDDGTNGDGVEEWSIKSNPNDANNNNIITMNVDFINFYQSWNNGCSFNIDNTQSLITADDNLCKPPSSTESSDGFYDCYIDNRPYLIVSKDIFENGLEYTFNFQIGDVDANDVFDNGPIYDFTYTEQEHTSINDLINNGPIYRYFTRTGIEGRKARLFVKYELLELFNEETNIQTCN